MRQPRNTPDTIRLNMATMTLSKMRLYASAAALAGLGLVLSGCMVGPNYSRPTATASGIATPPAFKEADGWKQAEPSDALEKGEWWEIFGDPVLSDLERQVEVSNQNLAAAVAA